MKPQFCMHLPFPLVVPLFTAGESRWSRLQSTFLQEALCLFLHNFTKAKLAAWLATPGYEHSRKVIAHWYGHNQKCFRQVQVVLSLSCGLWAFKVIRKMLSCVLSVLLVNFCIRYSWRYYFYLKNITQKKPLKSLSKAPVSSCRGWKWLLPIKEQLPGFLISSFSVSCTCCRKVATWGHITSI